MPWEFRLANEIMDNEVSAHSVSPARKYLQAFTSMEEKQIREQLEGLVGLVRLTGGNIEEGHWAKIYRNAQGYPSGGWSNKPFKDFIASGRGVEWKLYRPTWKTSWFGRSFMHPAATRTIAWDPSDPPEVSKVKILNQWTNAILEFESRAKETNTYHSADLRWGILLWDTIIPRFLYFEMPILIPDPSLFYAMQNEETNGNLWIYDNSGRKRYSVTRPDKGVKLQPYFDVPKRDEAHFYFEPKVRELEALWLESHVLKRIVLASAQHGRTSDELIELLLEQAGV